ncbi:hypothetical protein CAEBREN_11948 [Caenorhabditis brenneri]|uniref:Uncharacterized protein n=1 Tax=Caenorhabditis brenneri TaxID=135651 RepID=G0NFD7_CAEBE|nr:hypothetical protein CAEBREN_11948 [Caenorhabditis brenneri]
MGACSSCLRLLLDAESDVKIHVIEPTSINNGEGASVATQQPAAPEPTPPPVTTLQVPGMVRARTPEPTDPRVANL